MVGRVHELSLETKGRLDGLAGVRGEEGRREGGVHAGGRRRDGSADQTIGRDGGGLASQLVVRREEGGGLLDNVLKHAHAPAEVSVLGANVLLVTGEGGGLGSKVGRRELGHGGRGGGVDGRLDVLEDVGRGRCNGSEVHATASGDDLGRNAQVRCERKDAVGGARFARLGR